MDVSSPPEKRRALSHHDAILQKLDQHGIPQEYLDQSQAGLVAFVGENKSLLPEIVSCILPSDVDAYAICRSFKEESVGGQRQAQMKLLVSESLFWLQWLMFEEEPCACLKNLAQNSSGQRAVCGTVWKKNDLAYRCRTCEHDPTCAICVPCFQNGDHKGHDYSIMYSGGGCCDCGDVTAWKREGFCSKHKGSEQIQPLPDELASSIGPVLDALFSSWKDKMISMECHRPKNEDDRNEVHAMTHELSLAIIEMLLDFCNCSESLLSFVSKRMFACAGLLDALLMGERFLDKKVVKKLHELLLKLLGEPLFKYEFAKVFIRYYQIGVREIIDACTDSELKQYPLLSTFSVQIFTVPTLTPRLVREANLMGVLLRCLEDLFLSCVGEDGRLQAAKWANLYETTIRLVEDTRYVLSHEEVSQYIAKAVVDMSRAWMRLLSLVQGMDAQKRQTAVHTEEENDIIHTPFVLGHYLGNVHTLLGKGAFSLVEARESKDESMTASAVRGLDDDDGLYLAKVGRFSEGSSAGQLRGRIVPSHEIDTEGISEMHNHLSIPSSGVRLILECIKAIEVWLESENRKYSISIDATGCGGYNVMNLSKKIFRVKKCSNSNRVYRRQMSRERVDGDRVPFHDENHEIFQVMTTETRDALNQNNSSLDVNGMSNAFSGDACLSKTVDENSMEIDSVKDAEIVGLLSMAHWPDIVYDVSSQETSFHIPLHRFLSVLLRKALKCYAGMMRMPKAASSIPSDVHHREFFRQVLGGFHPYGFSAFVMEHPLRLRVFCAQVRAGMWRKNGDAAIMSSEWYRSVRWSEQGLESDLFLLQCCAALSPPELFVKRIQERFGLSDYTSLHHAEHNEYEPVLVQEMLALIIQIVKERRFCGFSTFENLCRELTYKLANGDATHSQLVKALPRDLSKSDQLQKAIDILAVYSKPSGMKQGKYSLREECWKDLDLYHPRWNSRELQVAEERYLRFRNVSALNVQLPQWSEIFYPMSTISRIATSKAVLQIIRAVFYYAFLADGSSANRAPDSVLITALHLLSLALDICEKSNLKCTEIDVDLSLIDDQPCPGAPCCFKYSFPILTYALEAFDVDGIDASVFQRKRNVLSLLVLLMRKYKEQSNKSYAETRQCDISSLIENLLRKFAHLSAECNTELRELEPSLAHNVFQRASDKAVKNVASDSGFEERRAKMRERQAAILEKMKAEQSKFIASLNGTSDDLDALASKKEAFVPYVVHDRVETKPICSFCRDPDSQSPLCYLILLQRSRLTSFVERGPLSWKDDDKSAKGVHLVNQSISSILADTTSGGPVHSIHTATVEFAFDTEPAELDVIHEFFRCELPHSKSFQLPIAPKATSTLELVEYDIYQSIRRIIHGSESHSETVGCDYKYLISHATEDLKKSKSVKPSVLGEYVAALSREMSKQHQSSIYSLLQLGNISSNSAITAAAYNGMEPGHCDGVHISSCGHAVHQECRERYLLSLKQRPIRRLGIEGHIVNPDMGELLCPVCRRFANSILPINLVSGSTVQRPIMPLSSSPASLQVSSTSADVLHLPLALTLLQSTAKMVGEGGFLKCYSGKLSESTEPALEHAIRKLCMLQYPHSYGSLISSGRLSHSLMLWNTLTYSLMSTEIASRGKNTHKRGAKSCLVALCEELHSSNGSILSLLISISQTSRIVNGLEMLLRFRAVQLFASSICSGFSGDINLSSTDKRRGTYNCIPEHTDKGEMFPDIQFWKRAADPILSSDPFSSLMLVLFSLPVPFMSSSDFFVALVHLFYVVAVIQALGTCYSNHCFDRSPFDDWVSNNVGKIIGEPEFAQKRFLAKYIDSSCYPTDMIRRLTLPYLRRCALLWKLMNSSALAFSFESYHTWEGLDFSANSDSVVDTNCLSNELNELGELQKMFHICSLEMVLQDELVRTLTSRWCQHFAQKFKACKHEHVFYATPAVPFRLMQLPRLYQDLLQRYIKQQCSHCKSVPDEPALCLICGKLCSPSWKNCCRANRCLEHAIVCGAGVGVFLLVRKTTILLQRSARQAFWPSLYLDAYGEEDLDMSRGRPLYLNEERYKGLAYLVASHGLDHTSEILRQTTISLFGSD
ncbi:putative carboxypeptidase U transcription factor interactor and regulator Znf-B family [Dioscorea sansibarensis]